MDSFISRMYSKDDNEREDSRPPAPTAASTLISPDLKSFVELQKNVEFLQRDVRRLRTQASAFSHEIDNLRRMVAMLEARINNRGY